MTMQYARQSCETRKPTRERCQGRSHETGTQDRDPKHRCRASRRGHPSNTGPVARRRARATPRALGLAFLVLTFGVPAHAEDAPGALAPTPSPEGAVVYIISPADGEIVSSPIRVRFGLKGMGVAPAGVQKPNTGHHHLLIDSKLPDPSQPVPADEKRIHFGGGQTETVIELASGTHTLRLLLADYRHLPHEPVVASETITISVK
jgi:hypothetical protein